MTDVMKIVVKKLYGPLLWIYSSTDSAAEQYMEIISF